MDYFQVKNYVYSGRQLKLTDNDDDDDDLALYNIVTQPDGTNYSNSLCIRTGASLGNSYYAFRRA